VALNLLLIPRAGLRGAVTASILTHGFLVLTYLGFVAHAYRTSFLDWRSLVLVAIAGLVVMVGDDIRPASAMAAAIALGTIGVGLKWSEVKGLVQGLTPRRPAVAGPDR
jgi:O-antigen/teichoic acid export membrane protein